MILYLRFRSDSESKLWSLASRALLLAKQVGPRSIESFKPLLQNEGSDDLPLLDGFDCPEWKRGNN